MVGNNAGKDRIYVNDIMTLGNCFQFRLLTLTSFIGKFVHSVGGEWRKGGDQGIHVIINPLILGHIFIVDLKAQISQQLKMI